MLSGEAAGMCRGGRRLAAIAPFYNWQRFQTRKLLVSHCVIHWFPL